MISLEGKVAQSDSGIVKDKKRGKKKERDSALCSRICETNIGQFSAIDKLRSQEGGQKLTGTETYEVELPFLKNRRGKKTGERR